MSFICWLSHLRGSYSWLQRVTYLIVTLGDNVQPTSSEDADVRVLQLEKDFFQLQNEDTLSKRTINSLREELVQEKLKSEKLRARTYFYILMLYEPTYRNSCVMLEYEELKHDLHTARLEKTGLERELTSSDQKFVKLETRLEETLKSSVVVKENRIQFLEGKLENIMKEKALLEDDIRGLKLRLEEKVAVSNSQAHDELDEKVSRLERENAALSAQLQQRSDVSSSSGVNSFRPVYASSFGASSVSLGIASSSEYSHSPSAELFGARDTPRKYHFNYFRVFYMIYTRSEKIS